MPEIRGTDADDEPANEADHFEICPVCGQAFDRRDLDQVLHHDEDAHDPIPPQA
jgi:hypothetical protein